MNHKKPRRLYNEEKFAVKRRCIRKRAPGTRAPQEMPVQPNDRWSLDCLSDVLKPGRRSRIPAAIDHCMRECLALGTARRPKASRAVMASSFASFPMCYGTVLTSRAIAEWQNGTGVA